MTAPIVSALLIITLLGALAMGMLSSRLREEVRLLLRAFDRSERTLVPLVTTIRRDHDVLRARLDALVEPGSRFDSTRR